MDIITLKDNMDTTSALSPIFTALNAFAEALNASATPSYDANARFFGIDTEVSEGELVHLLPSWGGSDGGGDSHRPQDPSASWGQGNLHTYGVQVPPSQRGVEEGILPPCTDYDPQALRAWRSVYRPH